jgi:hypothetical protein
MKAPEKIYVHVKRNKVTNICNSTFIGVNDIEYTRTDAFIEKACGWIKENITNNPNANSILVRNGCVTLGMLIEDFKNYMEDKL